LPRDLRHFHLRSLEGLGKAHPFRAKGAGRASPASNVPNRIAHAQTLLGAIDALPNVSELHCRSLEDDAGTRQTATVFASDSGVKNLRKKVEQFQTEDMPDREKNGVIIPGRPKNGSLVQSLGAIAEAGLRALWRSPPTRFPADAGISIWEVWLDPHTEDDFVLRAAAFGVVFGSERLEFPEDTIRIAHATRDSLALAVRHLGSVRALAAPSVTAEFFDGLDVIEQAQWVNDLRARTTYDPRLDAGYVTLFDKGVSRAHPLIRPALAVEDRHAADPAWGIEDGHGHGTQLAGLALFGDLTNALESPMPLFVGHRLESVKILPDAGANPHHLFGAVTRNAVNAVEANAARRRTFTMAVTTGEDTPHDGAPTSWSSEVDQLAAGRSGISKIPRLFIISAGNSDQSRFTVGHYLNVSDHPDNEIESPAQAWNAITVGAHTEKTILPQGVAGVPVAPFGDLSPTSRTASWNKTWPLKPDIVLEGGNWVADNTPPPMGHGSLSLLTTDHRFPMRSFMFSHDTSAATALASKQITELWSDYPDLWPETIRALYVGSARWTPQMLSYLPPNPQKGHYARLFRRYGYGVPDLVRARRSASNALTLIVEDTITPYGLSEKTGGDIHKEMKLFSLPWPVQALRSLGNLPVTLRVSLSSFIAPNPAEASRGTRYRYASHNLRFKLNRPGENAARFMSRISKLAEFVEGPANVEDDSWEFGSDRRDVGSLHIDQLTCPASDLARRNLIAVHPVTGWWKSKALIENGLPDVRYALVVEIDAENTDVDLYSETATAVAALVAAVTMV